MSDFFICSPPLCGGSGGLDQFDLLSQSWHQIEPPDFFTPNFFQIPTVTYSLDYPPTWPGNSVYTPRLDRRYTVKKIHFNVTDMLHCPSVLNEPKDDSGSVLMNRSENKKDKLQSSIRHQPNLKPTNFCVPGILSKCGAGTTWIEHRHCRFAKKSEYSNKCIHYIEAIDGHCDCIDAQRNAEIIVAD